MKLSTLLTPQAVIAQLNAADKKQALKLLAAKAAEITALPEREVYTVLLEREHVGCTGIGSGACIPHGRFENLVGLHAVFARLKRAIEFGAADGQPVDLLFLLLSPSAANAEHLKAMARLSKLLRDKQLCENLRSTRDAAIMHTLLLSAANDEDVT